MLKILGICVCVWGGGVRRQTRYVFDLWLEAGPEPVYHQKLKMPLGT